MRYLAIVTALLTGCLSTSVRTSTKTELLTSRERVVADSRVRAGFEVVPIPGGLSVRATLAQACHLEIDDVFRTTTLNIHESRGGGGGGGGGGLLIFPVVALVVVAVGVAAAAAASSHSETDEPVFEDSVTHRRVESNCGRPAANAQLQIAWPSGLVVTNTDGLGRARVQVPAAEPDHGEVSMRVAGAASATVVYFRDAESCRGFRAEQFAALPGVSHVKRAEMLDAIPGCPDEPGEATWRLVIHASRAAVDGKCRVLADDLGQLDPTLITAVYANVPEALVCRGAAAHRAAARAACFAERRDRQRHAQSITEVTERTRELLALPRCSP